MHIYSPLIPGTSFRLSHSFILGDTDSGSSWSAGILTMVVLVGIFYVIRGTWNQVVKKQNYAVAIIIVAIFITMAVTNPNEKDFEEATGNSNLSIANVILCSFCYSNSNNMTIGLFNHVFTQPGFISNIECRADYGLFSDDYYFKNMSTTKMANVNITLTVTDKSGTTKRVEDHWDTWTAKEERKINISGMGRPEKVLIFGSSNVAAIRGEYTFSK